MLCDGVGWDEVGWNVVGCSEDLLQKEIIVHLIDYFYCVSSTSTKGFARISILEAKGRQGYSLNRSGSMKDGLIMKPSDFHFINRASG